MIIILLYVIHCVQSQLMFEFNFINSRYHIMVEFNEWKEFKFIDTNG